MNKFIVLIVSSFISFSTLAASEISKDEAKNLTKVETINHTDRTITSAIKKISNDADNKGADFFVITETTSEGNGNSVTVIGDLYKK